MIHLPVSSTNSFSFLRRISNKSSTSIWTTAATSTTSTAPISTLPTPSISTTIPSSSSIVKVDNTIQPSRSYATSVFAGRPLPKALFSVPFLREPNDFLRSAQVAVKVCNPLINTITQDITQNNKVTSPVSGLRTLRKLDTISDTICKVLDAAECTRNIAGTSEWRNAAEEAFHGLSSYMYQLNAFRPLYEALCRITDDEVTMKALNEEQKRMAILLRREFERDGIHLTLSAREKVVQASTDIGQLTSKYLANMKDINYHPIKLSGLGIEEAVHQLPLHIQALFPQLSSSVTSKTNSTTSTSKDNYEHSPSIAAGALEAGGVSIAASTGNETNTKSVMFPTDPGIVAEILRLIKHEYVRAKLMMTVHPTQTLNSK